MCGIISLKSYTGSVSVKYVSTETNVNILHNWSQGVAEKMVT